MSIALGALQHALELLDERLSLLRVGPAQQLLGLLPRQLAAVQDHADRLAPAQTAEGPPGPPADSTAGRSARGPSRPGGATSSAAPDRPLLWGGGRRALGRADHLA